MGWQPMVHLMRPPSRKVRKRRREETINSNATTNSSAAAVVEEEEGDDEEAEGFILFAIDAVGNLAKEYSLCIGGEALAELIESVGRPATEDFTSNSGRSNAKGGDKGSHRSSVGKKEEEKKKNGEGEEGGEGDSLLSSTAARSGTAGGGGGNKRGALSRRMLRWLSHICPHVIVFARVAPDQKVG